MNDPYRVLGTGSRGWTNRALLNLALDREAVEAAIRRRVMIVVEGACPTGADDMMRDWVLDMQSRGRPVRSERHPAKGHPTQDFGPWPGAGPRRNRYMTKLGADVCLAFIDLCTSPRCPRSDPHDSHGASGCADLAENAGITTHRFRSAGAIDREGHFGEAAVHPEAGQGRFGRGVGGSRGGVG